jgi:hypothetical protein
LLPGLLWMIGPACKATGGATAPRSGATRGESLWASAGPPHLVEACAGSAPAPRPSAACAAFLATSERARLQWKLEQQLAASEAE